MAFPFFLYKEGIHGKKRWPSWDRCSPSPRPSGRLMAIADAYDALTSRRIYKDALSHEEALAIILEGQGSQFDPDITEAFQRCEGDFRKIAQSYQDQ